MSPRSDELLIYELLKGEVKNSCQSAINEHEIALVWRISSNCWESEWLRYILQGLYNIEIEDKTSNPSCTRLIVVDNLDLMKARQIGSTRLVETA